MPFSFIQASYRKLLRKGGWDALIRFVPKGSGEEGKALSVRRTGLVNKRLLLEAELPEWTGRGSGTAFALACRRALTRAVDEGAGTVVLLLPDDSFGYPAETLLRAARREVYMALEEEDLRVEIASPERPGIGVPSSVLEEVGNMLRRHGLLPGGVKETREEAPEYSASLLDEEPTLSEDFFAGEGSFDAAQNIAPAGQWRAEESTVSDDTLVIFSDAQEAPEPPAMDDSASPWSFYGHPASGQAPSAAPPLSSGGMPAGAPAGGDTAQLPGREEIRREEARRKAAGTPKHTYAAAKRPTGSMPDIPPVKHPDQGLSRALARREDTFQVQLFRMIDSRGMTDAEVYRRANLDRRLFSKIRSNPNYQPKKQTALALAIGLGLSLSETQDLLQRAGLALSRSSTFDLIIRYCIEEGIDDIFSVNALLYTYDQPLLGG